MILIKTILPVLLVVMTVFSQQIKISGKVTDTSGVNPIEGVVVKLEKHGYTGTTGADGNFTLTGATSIGSNSSHFQPNALFADVRNGVLTLRLPERSAVAITTYTMQGKAVSIIRKILDMGAHNIAQPDLGHGVYIYKIQAGSRELVLKGSSLGRTGRAFTLSSPTMVTVANARCYVSIDDVIFASKEGLLNYRVTVTNSDTNGIVIRMIPNAGNVTDADGNVYQSVRIGDQVWTVENWRSTKYNDGTAIPNISGSTPKTPGYCYYNNTTNADTIKKWGALYNWYTVVSTNPKKIAPAGWRVPAETDWDKLQNSLIANGYNWDGTTTENKIAKALAAQTDWTSYDSLGTIGKDLAKNNRSGFSALPGGYRDRDGKFGYWGINGDWWSASKFDEYAMCRYLYYSDDYLYFYSFIKGSCLSLRLVRDAY